MKKNSSPLTCSNVDAFTSWDHTCVSLFLIRQLQVPASFWDTLSTVYVCFQLLLVIGEPFSSHIHITDFIFGVTLQFTVSRSPSKTSAGVKETAEIQNTMRLLLGSEVRITDSMLHSLSESWLKCEDSKMLRPILYCHEIETSSYHSYWMIRKEHYHC